MKQRISKWANIETSYFETDYTNLIFLKSLGPNEWLFVNEAESTFKGGPVRLIRPAPPPPVPLHLPTLRNNPGSNNAPGADNKPGGTANTVSHTGTPASKSPATGDDHMLVLWIMLMSISIIGAISLTTAQKRNRLDDFE